MSGVDERETPLERDQPSGEEQAAAADGGTGWPTTPAEIPLDGPIGPLAETETRRRHPSTTRGIRETRSTGSRVASPTPCVSSSIGR